MNHFAIKCCSTSQRQQQRPTREVKNVTLASTPISRVGLFDDSRNDETAVPPVKTLSAHQTGTAGNCQRETVDRVEMDRNVGYTTLVVGSHKVKFEYDTGSPCNILPLRDYKLATGDDNLQQITQTADTITVYGGRKIRVTGNANLQVHRNGKSYELHFKVMSGANYQPLLSRPACMDIGALRWIDDDSIHPLCESTASVNSTDTGAKQTAAVNERQSDKLHAEYADVFEGLGRLPGQHHIKLDSAVHPVIHAPRRVPVALRDELKTKLDEMVQQDIITPVTEPTDWVSSVLLIAKPGKLRVCLDPRDLNIAIMREHYPMPTLEEISTRLGRASVFTVLDAKSGFWQVELDEESS